MALWSPAAFMAALKEIEPPDGEGPRWRWAMFLFVGMLAIGLLVHVAWACGYVPFAEGFAREDEVAALSTRLALSEAQMTQRVKTVQSKLDTITELQLKQDMRAVARELCHAKAPDDRMQRAEELDELQSRYSGYAGHEWLVPACGEL